MIPGDFQIEVFALPFGRHRFEFKADESFLNNFSHNSIEKASISALFTILKKNFIQEADITIQVKILLNCNRCNLPTFYTVNASHHVVIKRGNPACSNEEIIFADEKDEFVDFSQFVYDTILTNIPARIIPCEVNAGILCNKEILNKLQNIELFEEPKESSSEQIQTLGDVHSDLFKKLSNHFNN